MHPSMFYVTACPMSPPPPPVCGYSGNLRIYIQYIWHTVNVQGVRGKDVVKEAECMIEDLQLQDKKNTPSLKLSGGMKRKLRLVDFYPSVSPETLWLAVLELLWLEDQSLWFLMSPHPGLTPMQDEPSGTCLYDIRRGEPFYLPRIQCKFLKTVDLD